MQLKVLVTGANGFVGAHLGGELVTQGYQVIGAVRRKPANMPDDTAINYMEVGDLGPHGEWFPALSGVQAVVHLSGRVHVMREPLSDPLTEFRRVNVAATENLARQAANAGVRRFVYVSSIKVNGERTWDRPFTEVDPPSPADAYAVSKWEAEQALAKVAQETGLEVVILRPPLVYGPGVAANFLELMRWVDRGIPFPFASIRNRRSLIYVGNLVSAIQRSLEHPSAAGQTFLVCDDESLSTPELIGCLAASLGRHPRLLPFPVPLLRLMGVLAGRMSQIERLTESLVVDSSKIRGVMDWRPPYSLEDGLAETSGWFRGGGTGVFASPTIQ